MNNETDLDWLARNEHKWPGGDHHPWCYVYWKSGRRAVSGNCITVIQPCAKIEKEQWTARRAELQNKPSWSDAPEWAEWLAQVANGAWFFSALPVEVHENGVSWWSPWRKDTKITSWGAVGEVLGDWRDTLELRPSVEVAECYVKSEPTVGFSVAAFEPFTSIEDNQEKVMKQDNGWHEREELPPVGTECEYTLGDCGIWYRCKINYVIAGDGVVMLSEAAGEQYCSLHSKQPVTFRPIRTERNVLLSVIVEEMNHYDTDGKLADAILAAGFSLGAK